jgi:enoyl-CoA hydratase
MKRSFDAIFNCYSAIRNSAVPVIAVVQGRALGFGCALAAVADITIAEEAAEFQVPEMAHNILPTMVMSSFIDRVPRKAFIYLIYSTAVINAQRALSFGIVSDVQPAAQLEQAVLKLTAAIVQAPQPALLGVKEYARTAFDMPLPGAIDYAKNLHAVINSSSEMRHKS